MGVKLTFLGSGSAFTVGGDNFQSNVLLTAPSGRRFLIDCGTDIRFSLHAEGLSYRDITDIYISHLHSDHAGGLEYIGFTTKFDPHCEQPTLYVSQDIAVDLWHKSLAGGMEAIEGDLADLSSYFKLHPLKPNGCFTWEGITFHLVKLNHIDTGFMLMPAYGLFFEVNGCRIFFSNDTKLCFETLQTYFEDADIIFHDCEITPHPTSVHAHYQELANLPLAIKQKMWLYGYQPGQLPPATKDGFLGFVKRGQDFCL
ncbi:MAG: MBL fold metallo-hydrolase [Synechocystis sp.]|nr:MBL fold metallo-hydrolase [Synechocystis sp.]